MRFTGRVTKIDNKNIMENSEQKILSDLTEMISSLRQQLVQLENKIDQLQTQLEVREAAPQDVVPDDMEPIDIMISDDFQIVEAVPQQEVTQEDPEIGNDLPFDDLPVEDPVEESVEESVVEESVAEESVADESPVLFEVPQSILQKAEASSKASLADAMVAKQAWRTDVPGAPVKDVRGAIALMDRVIFINKLFRADPMAFQDALTQINQMETLDQAVDYLSADHPEWNMDSEIVYRFMMAIRRKVN